VPLRSEATVVISVFAEVVLVVLLQAAKKVQEIKSAKIIFFIVFLFYD
jgi:hypothetical protein